MEGDLDPGLKLKIMKLAQNHENNDYVLIQD